MRILILHRYYPPDESSCGQIMSGLAEYFAGNGNNVRVLTGYPSYRNESIKHVDKSANVNDLQVTRVFLPNENKFKYRKILNLIKFSLVTSFFLMRSRYDVVIVTSMPPIFSAFFCIMICKIKKIKSIYYVMDIYPEVGKISGDFKNLYFYSLLRYLDSKTCLHASQVLVHSQDMYKTIISRPLGRLFNIKILNNFYNDKYQHFKADDCKSNESKTFFKIVYAGNIGRFQNLNLVIDIFKRLNQTNFQLVFVGYGVEYENLVDRVKRESLNIIFTGHKDSATAIKYIKNADICLISLEASVIDCAYPSKTMAYLYQGKPLLALVEKYSELAKMIVDRKIGFVLDVDNIDNSVDLLNDISTDRSWMKNSEINSKRTFEELFSKDIILAKWQELL